MPFGLNFLKYFPISTSATPNTSYISKLNWELPLTLRTEPLHYGFRTKPLSPGKVVAGSVAELHSLQGAPKQAWYETVEYLPRRVAGFLGVSLGPPICAAGGENIVLGMLQAMKVKMMT